VLQAKTLYDDTHPVLKSVEKVVQRHYAQDLQPPLDLEDEDMLEQSFGAASPVR
jgi:hypothetical protein